MPNELAIMEQATQMLAECKTVDEAKDIIDKAAAAQVWARKAKLGLLAQNHAAYIKLRAERKAGEILAGLTRTTPKERAKAGGHAKAASSNAGQSKAAASEYAMALEGAGATRQDANRWQKVAAIPEEDFQRIAEDAKDAEQEITTTLILRGAGTTARKRKKKEKQESLANKNLDLPPEEKRYSVILADPPWQYECNLDNDRAVDNHYPTMQSGSISHLKIGDRSVSEIAHDDAIFFMWTTSPKVSEACDIIKAWGFRYVGCAIWDKVNIGIGNYFRIQHELLLFATRGEIGTPEVKDRPTWSVYKEKRGKHSVKPIEFHRIIESMYPSCSKIELFSRSKREGWDAWGYEADG